MVLRVRNSRGGEKKWGGEERKKIELINTDEPIVFSFCFYQPSYHPWPPSLRLRTPQSSWLRSSGCLFIQLYLFYRSLLYWTIVLFFLLYCFNLFIYSFLWHCFILFIVLFYSFSLYLFLIVLFLLFYIFLFYCFILTVLFYFIIILHCCILLYCSFFRSILFYCIVLFYCFIVFIFYLFYIVLLYYFFLSFQLLKNIPASPSRFAFPCPLSSTCSPQIFNLHFLFFVISTSYY